MLRDFIKCFGKKVYTKVMDKAGHHSTYSPPNDKRDRLIFSLLEILDFECYKYGDVDKKLTENEIKKFLLKHREKIRAYKGGPPSYLGLAIGKFNFLKKEG